MADFDLARPLWRVTLLEGLAGGRAALIVKLHHAIADGQGAMMLGATVIDLVPGGQDLGPMPPAPSRLRWTPRASWARPWSMPPRSW